MTPAPHGAGSCHVTPDADGAIDAADLVVLLSLWGRCPATPACTDDFNDDSQVDGGDLGELLSAWMG